MPRLNRAATHNERQFQLGLVNRSFRVLPGFTGEPEYEKLPENYLGAQGTFKQYLVTDTPLPPPFSRALRRWEERTRLK